jgi:hypothetical protein
MNQIWRDWRSWRDLAGGILLVLLIDSLFWLPMVIGFDQDVKYFYKNTILSLIILLLAFIQFFYLIPIMLYFQRRRRFAVVTGISIGSIITILLCAAVWWSSYTAGYADLSVVIVPPLLGITVLVAFYYRSRSK